MKHLEMLQKNPSKHPLKYTAGFQEGESPGATHKNNQSCVSCSVLVEFGNDGRGFYIHLEIGEEALPGALETETLITSSAPSRVTPSGKE